MKGKALPYLNVGALRAEMWEPQHASLQLHQARRHSSPLQCCYEQHNMSRYKRLTADQVVVHFVVNTQGYVTMTHDTGVTQSLAHPRLPTPPRFVVTNDTKSYKRPTEFPGRYFLSLNTFVNRRAEDRNVDTYVINSYDIGFFDPVVQVRGLIGYGLGLPRVLVGSLVMLRMQSSTSGSRSNRK